MDGGIVDGEAVTSEVVDSRAVNGGALDLWGVAGGRCSGPWWGLGAGACDPGAWTGGFEP